MFFLNFKERYEFLPIPIRKQVDPSYRKQKKKEAELERTSRNLYIFLNRNLSFLDNEKLRKDTRYLLRNNYIQNQRDEGFIKKQIEVACDILVYLKDRGRMAQFRREKHYLLSSIWSPLFHSEKMKILKTK